MNLRDTMTWLIEYLQDVVLEVECGTKQAWGSVGMVRDVVESDNVGRICKGLHDHAAIVT